MNVGQVCCWCNVFSYCDRAQCWCLCGHIEDLSRTDTVQPASGSVCKHVHEMPGDKLNWHGWLKWAWLGKKKVSLYSLPRPVRDPRIQKKHIQKVRSVVVRLRANEVKRCGFNLNVDWRLKWWICLPVTGVYWGRCKGLEMVSEIRERGI